jgi:hypothetical protein
MNGVTIYAGICDNGLQVGKPKPKLLKLIAALAKHQFKPRKHLGLTELKVAGLIEFE